MRSAVLFSLLTLLACDRAPVVASPEGSSPPAASAEPSPAPVWPSAGPAWASINPAAGANTEAPAGTVPGTFRNAEGVVACPVMGMAINKPEDAVSYADFEGVRYFFCCDSCEKLFLDNPAEYANGKYMNEHSLDRSAPAACEEEKAG